jgi:hypothetical protein
VLARHPGASVFRLGPEGRGDFMLKRSDER